jgi:membrane associated rhomboid family serine protease
MSRGRRFGQSANSLFAAGWAIRYFHSRMFFENSGRDIQPLTRLGSLPVYGTTILVAALVVGLIASSLSQSFGLIAGFDPELFWKHGQVWRAVSYLAVDHVNFFTIFNLLFLYGFGRDCEQELGRSRYFAFVGLLVATPVVVTTLAWLCGFEGILVSSTHLSMGLVIAFATIYPNVLWWASIPMKFVAVGCMFLAAVGHLGRGDQIGFAATLATCAVSFGYIKAMRAGVIDGISLTSFARRKPKPRDTRGDMDALLDKIAKSGMDSLSAKERARLQSARKEMLNKDQR